MNELHDLMEKVAPNTHFMMVDLSVFHPMITCYDENKEFVSAWDGASSRMRVNDGEVIREFDMNGSWEDFQGYFPDEVTADIFMGDAHLLDEDPMTLPIVTVPPEVSEGWDWFPYVERFFPMGSCDRIYLGDKMSLALPGETEDIIITDILDTSGDDVKHRGWVVVGVSNGEELCLFTEHTDPRVLPGLVEELRENFELSR